MSNKQKKYGPEFNAKVALSAMKNDETLTDLDQWLRVLLPFMGLSSNLWVARAFLLDGDK